MTRRSFLASAAVAAGAAGRAAAAPARSGMGFSPDCFVLAKPGRSVKFIEYLQYSYDHGAGGAQGYLTSFDPADLKALRDLAEKLGMYVEVTTMLPKDDAAAADFEKVVKGAKEVGARCMRSVCLGGRRYETFNTLAEFEKFAQESKAKLARIVPILERNKMHIGIENHKDWTVEQMVPLLKSYDSEYLGVCIDWGNNMSLLDDPMELVERLAPFCINSHIKDMAVEEYADGFYLAEVPLGQGMLPLKRMMDTILAARPNVKFSLDMLTRDPLRITCLTDKYWATFPDRNGVYMARMLRMVRANKPKQPLVWISKLDKPAALQVEQENIRQSIEFSRDGLGLKI
jgi:3-oxoisoapionate decarboxylase